MSGTTSRAFAPTIALVTALALGLAACSTKPHAHTGGLTAASAPSTAAQPSPAPSPVAPTASTPTATVTQTVAKTATAKTTKTTKPPTKSPTPTKTPSATKTPTPPPYELKISGLYANCDASLSASGTDAEIGAFFTVSAVSGTAPGTVAVTFSVTNATGDSPATVFESTNGQQFFELLDIGPASTWAGKTGVFMYATVKTSGTGTSSTVAVGVDIPSGIASFTPGAPNGVPCKVNLA